MKIQLISDGSIPVPPTDGWGALERVVWNYKINLEKEGHDVIISNHKESALNLEDWRKFKPDIVHNHIGKHWEAVSLMSACKKIVTNHGGEFLSHKPFYEYLARNYFADCQLIMLTDAEKLFYESFGLKAQVLPNGVDTGLFNPSNNKDRHGAIYLGQINPRKKQAFFQSRGINCYFAGNKADTSFDYTKDNYLGSWNHEQVCQNLVKFSNLILLSASELQPLVCLEGLAAGLGLVITKQASQSLDLSKPWISIIPDDKLDNIDYINHVIQENSYISNVFRNDIIEYSKTFDWSNIIKTYLEIVHNG
jgi:glycosyltransferase involved in cell wall biosynthesis